MSALNHSRPQPIALNFMATFEPSTGWSMVVHVASLGENGVISDRLRYAGLTAMELLDVIEASAARKLLP